MIDYKKIAESHASLKKGLVKCKTCGRELKTNSSECLVTGWPKCCGYTMNLLYGLECIVRYSKNINFNINSLLANQYYYTL